MRVKMWTVPQRKGRNGDPMALRRRSSGCDTRINLTSNSRPAYVFCVQYNLAKLKLGLISARYQGGGQVVREDRRLVSNDPTAAAQNREAASRTAGPWGGVSLFPNPTVVDPRISRLTALMHRAMHRKLPLCELAGATGLSVSRLCHLFKSHTGLGPAQYLKSLRMQRARELLEKSVLSVKEIGARLGYDDSSRFVEAFRKMHGLTPLRHRRLALRCDCPIAMDLRPRTSDYGQRTNAARLAYK